MIKVIFVCHGSICRSPAAEMIFRDEIKKSGLESKFETTSLALSLEEIGNDIYPPMKAALRANGIPFIRHSARRLTQADLDGCDRLFYMDESNRRILSYLVNDSSKKCLPVFAYSKGIYEIEDPWYSDNYQLVIDELRRCVNDILTELDK
ncbi:MAG: low molecular weight phosphotyrosine protein phosphatase [Bacilli bacterium]|nr:low molecular weight phosphotyrosine protein phosphatase [Bacilli bacterium]